MKHTYRYSIILVSLILSSIFCASAQQGANDSLSYYTQVKTYVNPVLPGDHPDPTLLKVGNDFYYCGSTFHFTPYLPIYHSKDLIHWKIISRVVSPPSSIGWVTDKPSGGIWQGALTYFYGSYWVYFSSNGQWFSKANSPKGPWSKPVRVRTNPQTGPLGYDNSIFVDDGKPYMLIKNGRKINRIQAIGRDGQLTDTVINLDWVNKNLQYNWAEGPVMCKRNGFYYYFVAGSVAGGEYVLRTRTLTSDSAKWERLGNFFEPITDPNTGFRVPNHIAAPIKLADGSWWTIAQSYERYKRSDWTGMGRQTSLYRIIWKGNRPWGTAPVSTPLLRPDLPQSGILWRSVHSDYFNTDSLNVCWHFLNRDAARSYSLSDRKGWLQLIPDTGRTHILQKETDHYYSAVTKVDLNADNVADKAGLYLTNGNQSVTVQLYSGYNNGKKMIVFKLDTAMREAPNIIGKVVWLKIERKEHELTGYYSSNGNDWNTLGAPISAVSLDREQPNFNSWVGTSVGLFAEGEPAYFDFFICKDGFSSLPVVGYRNYFGIETSQQANEKVVTNTSHYGGWLTISGVDLGRDKRMAGAVEVNASSLKGGKLEIWLDGLSHGKRIATIYIKATGNSKNFKTFSQKINPVSGHHDVFVKFSPGVPGNIYIRSIKFLKAKL